LYAKDIQGKYYKFNEYISEILKDENLANKFNPNKELKEALCSGADVNLQNLQKLDKNEFFEKKNDKQF